MIVDCFRDSVLHILYIVHFIYGIVIVCNFVIVFRACDIKSFVAA